MLADRASAAMLVLLTAGCSMAGAADPVPVAGGEALPDLERSVPRATGWTALPPGRSFLRLAPDENGRTKFAQVERAGLEVVVFVMTPGSLEEACYAGLIDRNGRLARGQYTDPFAGGDDGVQSSQRFAPATLPQLLGPEIEQLLTAPAALAGMDWRPPECREVLARAKDIKPDLKLRDPS